jgi:cation transport regulator ChaB
MTTAEEKTIAEREALLSAWRTATFTEGLLAQIKSLSTAIQGVFAAQLLAAQSVAKDAEQMREAADKAPAAHRASDIARDACVLFVDRTTDRTKGTTADEAMRDCVRLATIARELAEKQ